MPGIALAIVAPYDVAYDVAHDVAYRAVPVLAVRADGIVGEFREMCGPHDVELAKVSGKCSMFK